MKKSIDFNISDFVLYKNKQLIAFNKLSGLPVQKDKTGDKALADLAEIYVKSKVFLTHRIDRPASGIVLFAKNPKALAHINAQFQHRSIKKTYLAVVAHKPDPPSATLKHHLLKNGKINKSRVVAPDTKGAKMAELHYEYLESIDNYHLLKIELFSGRHHQIRAQLAAINAPIKGDVKYGARRNNKNRSIHLHAWQLEFQHPVTQEVVRLNAEVPTETVWQSFKMTQTKEL